MSKLTLEALRKQFRERKRAEKNQNDVVAFDRDRDGIPIRTYADGRPVTPGRSLEEGQISASRDPRIRGTLGRGDGMLIVIAPYPTATEEPVAETHNTQTERDLAGESRRDCPQRRKQQRSTGARRRRRQALRWRKDHQEPMGRRGTGGANDGGQGRLW